MSLGGWRPGAERYGSTDDTYRRIFEALNKACGTAYDTDSSDSNVAMENHAIARAVAEAWNTNKRLSYMHDPLRCPYSALVRWERICRLYPLTTDTVPARRRRLAAHLARFGVAPTYQVVSDRLTDALPNVFVQLNHIDVADANTHWPGGSPAEANEFSSTVCHALVKLQKPAGYSEGQFYDAAGKSTQVLDGIMPSHMTFDWYRNGTLGVGIGSWTTDPDAGFYLDEDHNLDNELLDV